MKKSNKSVNKKLIHQLQITENYKKREFKKFNLNQKVCAIN